MYYVLYFGVLRIKISYNCSNKFFLKKLNSLLVGHRFFIDFCI